MTQVQSIPSFQIRWEFDKGNRTLFIYPQHAIYTYNFVSTVHSQHDKENIKYIRERIGEYTFRGDIESWTNEERIAANEVVPSNQTVSCVIRGTLRQISPNGYRLDTISSVDAVNFKTPFS